MSTRIIIKSLPNDITPSRLKEHFSSSHSGNAFFAADVTDAKLVTDVKTGKSRGFAFVGYRTTEDAQKAVEWFNGTFVDLRKISVEIAKRAGDESLGQSWREKNREYHERQKRQSEEKEKPGKKKRKLNNAEVDGSEKVAAIKELTGSKRKNKLLAQNPDLEKAQETANGTEVSDVVKKGDKTQKSKKRKLSVSEPEEPKKRVEVVAQPAVIEVIYDDSAAQPQEENVSTAGETEKPTAPPQSDLDWLRSRTSRTLGLVSDDDDEESEKEDQHSKPKQSESEPELDDEEASIHATPLPNLPSDTEKPDQAQLAPAESKVLKTGRLFVRNLVYGVTEEDLRGVFSPYGPIEEVSPFHCT
jgi:multiple RNA-binding domain-containing protein 1